MNVVTEANCSGWGQVKKIIDTKCICWLCKLMSRVLKGITAHCQLELPTANQAVPIPPFVVHTNCTRCGGLQDPWLSVPKYPPDVCWFDGTKCVLVLQFSLLLSILPCSCWRNLGALVMQQSTWVIVSRDCTSGWFWVTFSWKWGCLIFHLEHKKNHVFSLTHSQCLLLFMRIWEFLNQASRLSCWVQDDEDFPHCWSRSAIHHEEERRQTKPTERARCANLFLRETQH